MEGNVSVGVLHGGSLAFRRLALSLRVLLASMLALVGLPVRAEMVCVVRGRVVAACPMTTLPRAGSSMADCPMRGRACCGPKESHPATKTSVRAAAHCKFATGARPVLAVDRAAGWARPFPPFVVDPPSRGAFPIEARRENTVEFPGAENGPSRARPYVPDRGRAPPARAELAV